MFVESSKVYYSALFTYLVGWHTSAVSLPPSDVTLAQLAYPLSDVMFCLQSGILNLSLYKRWPYPKMNTQAYYDTTKITATNSFIVQALEDSDGI
jgi:hypothetical protein